MAGHHRVLLGKSETLKVGGRKTFCNSVFLLLEEARILDHGSDHDNLVLPGFKKLLAELDQI